jgi:hypothetical protein
MLHYNHSLQKLSNDAKSLSNERESMYQRKFLCPKDRRFIDAIEFLLEPYRII